MPTLQLLGAQATPTLRESVPAQGGRGSIHAVEQWPLLASTAGTSPAADTRNSLPIRFYGLFGSLFLEVIGFIDHIFSKETGLSEKILTDAVLMLHRNI